MEIAGSNTGNNRNQTSGDEVNPESSSSAGRRRRPRRGGDHPRHRDERIVRGPSVVEEYYDRPEADATDFVAADDGGARWLPDDVRFREAIPKTATGKFDKKTLRETVEDPELPYAPGEGGGE
jgi:acyl-CoA synthetase (AMP-forming)/AMP-acid ligase II